MPATKSVLDRNQRAMERAELAAVRSTARAYNQARRELLATLLERWAGIGVLTPGRAVDVARRLGLLESIDARMQQLERETGEILRDIVVSSTERGVEAIARELDTLSPAIRRDVQAFTQIRATVAERFVPMAIQEGRLQGAALSNTLQRELQAGLLQGESFDALTTRLFATERPSAFRQGRVSAARAARRLVIHAENAARVDAIAVTAQTIPEVRKQAIAVMQDNTTDTCVAVHGQIQRVDQPFDLQGYEPQFAQFMQHTPFHWNCRTAITTWHPSFEQGGLTTANMLASARAERRRRAS